MLYSPKGETPVLDAGLVPSFSFPTGKEGSCPESRSHLRTVVARSVAIVNNIILQTTITGLHFLTRQDLAVSYPYFSSKDL